MTERFMVDDAGTLIDMQTRDMFDIVEEVCPLLNEQHETIQRLKQNIDELLSVNIEEELLKENEQLKQVYTQLKHRHSLLHDVCLDAECERDSLKKDVNSLEKENERLTDKLNQTALELVDGVISQGKAVEISEMSYSEFLDYRAKNGKPMELQL